MSYYFTSTIKEKDFDRAIERVKEELKMEGFGVLTEIDVKDTFKRKIEEDFKKYTILGACNPHFAFKALTSEDKIGVFLPCNVVVEESEEGNIEVTAVDPVASMTSVNNKELEGISTEVQLKLKRVIEALSIN